MTTTQMNETNKAIMQALALRAHVSHSQLQADLSKAADAKADRMMGL